MQSISVINRNNPAIDYDELTRRIALGSAPNAVPAPSALPPAPTPVSPPPAAVVAQPEARPQSNPPAQSQADRHPSFFRTLANLSWAIRHVRLLTRRSIAAVYAAEYAQPRIACLEAMPHADPAHVEQLDARTATLAHELEARTTPLDQRLAQLTTHVAQDHLLMEDRLDNLAAAAVRAEQATTLAIAEAVAKANADLALLRREVMFQQRRLTCLLSEAGTETPSPAAAQPAAAQLVAGRLVAGRHDTLYALFEDVFRGARADIKQRLGPYVEQLTAAGAGAPGTPVLDIGCGRGEWLELLGDNGLAAYGIDSNTIMVERCVALKLDARCDDLLAHLAALPDASRSAVTAFHVIEHLEFALMVDFIDEVLRVLIPGGIMILETPNAETMRVGATTFYNDPSHRNPVLPQPLRFIVAQRGFTEIEIIPRHPFTQGLLQAPTEDADLLNRVLFGPQDYALVARRP